MGTYGFALGDLVDVLRRMDPDAVIQYGFAKPHSYRGYYERVAFVPTGKAATAGELFAVAHSALGATFIGWKGGAYTMHRDTLVHVAYEGSTGPQVFGFGLVLGDDE